MKRSILILAASLAAAPAGAQVAVHWDNEAPGARALPAAALDAAVPAVGAAAEAAPQQAAPAEELAKAQASLQKLIDKLKAMVAAEQDRGRKLELYEALDQAQAALDGVNKALFQQQSGVSRKLDETVVEVRLLQRILSSFLGTPDNFQGIHMKREPVEIDIVADAGYEVIRKKLPFLDVQGRVRVRPGQEMISRFNEVKAEFHGILLEAAHLDSTDSRVKSLAKWGKDTEVIYPGQSWMEKKPILTSSQYNDIVSGR